MLALLTQGTAISFALFAPFGIVIAAVSATVAAFNRFAWHWAILHGWLVKKPHLDGTWLVELKSDYIEPNTGKNIDPILCFMVIRQTYSSLSIRLITKESKSETLTASVTLNSDETYNISGVYRNSPSPEFRDRSEIHFGALVLHTSKRRPITLEGQYWTDRKTKGSLKLSSRQKVFVDSYSEAESHFPSASPSTA